MAGLIITIILFYLLCGLLFSALLFIKGIDRIDPAARHTGFGFRLIVLPGLIALWPFLVKKFLTAIKKNR